MCPTIHVSNVRAGSGLMVEPLIQLIQIAFGPKKVISNEFAGIPGIDELMLFGSWAARYRAMSSDPRRRTSAFSWSRRDPLWTGHRSKCVNPRAD